MRLILRRSALLLLTFVLVGTAVPAGATGATATMAAPAPAAAAVNDRMVVVISVDGLSRRAVRKLGSDQLPNIYRLLRGGVSTLNARTQPERTTTLPNHVSMMTGRRINRRHGGHGVWWNYDRRDRTVQSAAREWVSSTFHWVHRAGGRTAVFATKPKFSIFDRSWPDAVHHDVVRDGGDRRATRLFREHLLSTEPSFSLLHLGNPDRVGHDTGWMSGPYRRAVRRTDRKIGSILRLRRDHPTLGQRLSIILTADHGGVPGTTGHSKSRHPEDYRVPFTVFGSYVGRGSIYRRSPDYLWPGRDWIPATGQQPVRNGDAANLAMDILGLGPVPDSLWGTTQELNWRR